MAHHRDPTDAGSSAVKNIRFPEQRTSFPARALGPSRSRRQSQGSLGPDYPTLEVSPAWGGGCSSPSPARPQGLDAVIETCRAGQERTLRPEPGSQGPKWGVIVSLSECVRTGGSLKAEGLGDGPAPVPGVSPLPQQAIPTRRLRLPPGGSTLLTHPIRDQ